jgi:hypothetical protein
MNARLLSSFIWVLVLIVPPLRWALRAVAELLWPNVQPFTLLSGLMPTWGSVVGVSTCGYILTWVWARYHGLSWLKLVAGIGAQEGRRRGDVFVETVAIVATLAWSILLAMQGRLEGHRLLTAIFVLLGIVRFSKDARQSEPQPSPVPEPLPEPEPVVPVDEQVFFAKHYHWLFNDQPFLRDGRTHHLQLQLWVRKEIYEEYRARDHHVHQREDYIRFINEELDDEVIVTLAQRMRALIREYEFDRLTEIHLAMAFTLSFAYVSDDMYEGYNGEYPKYPVEILVDEGGDCEDHASLCGALLHGLGHKVSLVLMDVDEDSGHAALAVESPEEIPGTNFSGQLGGRDRYYCEVTPCSRTTRETTEVQWWLGRQPMSGAHDFTLWPIG